MGSNSIESQVLMAALKKQDFDVVAEVNGAGALRVMEQPDAPKIAILDWMMTDYA